MEKKFTDSLPSIFQTVPNRKFFGATADHLFSESSDNEVTGYVGRRISGTFDPKDDYYLPEISKNRTWYQFEPTLVDNRGNVFFDEYLKYLEKNGSDVTNLDRLFSSDYTTFCPPIDVDMFINFQNYFWIPNKVPAIEVTESNPFLVEGNVNYTATHISGTAVELKNGHRLRFSSSSDIFTVTGVGKPSGIQLVPDLDEILPNDISGSSEYTLEDVAEMFGITLEESENIDIGTLMIDYFTIERGSLDANMWSRTNKWYHSTVVEESIFLNEVPFPIYAKRAVRPIICFKKNIELYNNGSFFMGNVFGATNEISTELFGNNISDLLTDYPWLLGISVGDLVLFNDGIFIVSDAMVFSGFHQEDLIEGGTYLCTGGTRDNLYGKFFYVKDGQVLESQNKTRNNLEPLFEIYDYNGIPLSNKEVYPDSDYFGNKVFSYSVSESSIVDPILNIGVLYRDGAQNSDILFNNNLVVDRYRYISSSGIESITGEYFYRNILGENEFENSWHYGGRTEINVFYKDMALPEDDRKYLVSETIREVVSVSSNGIEVDYQIVNQSGSNWVEITGTVDDFSDISIEFKTDDPVTEGSNSFYQVPYEIQNNQFRENITDIKYGDLVPQCIEIIENQSGSVGSAFSPTNNYLNTEQDISLGKRIIMPTSSAVRLMQFARDDLSLKMVSEELKRKFMQFKMKLLSAASMYDVDFFTTNIGKESVIRKIFDEIVDNLIVSRDFNSSFGSSFMIPTGDPVFTEEFVASYKTIVYEKRVPNTRMISIKSDDIGLWSTFKVIDASNNQVLNDYFINIGSGEVTIDLALSMSSDEIRVENKFLHLDISSLPMDITRTDVITLLSKYIEGTGSLRTRSHITLNHGVDYAKSSETIFFNSNGNVSNGAKILLSAFTDFDASGVPPTPAKLGISEVYTPGFFVDETAVEKRVIIRGHDGSETSAFTNFDRNGSIAFDSHGNPIPSSLSIGTNIRNMPDIDKLKYFDLRDLILIEFEKEILANIEYNLIVDNRLRATTTDVFIRHGFGSDIDALGTEFIRWTSEYQVDYRENQFYNPSEWKTWNYSEIQNYIYDNDLGSWEVSKGRMPGSWKGIFIKFFGTEKPHTNPWEMLGFTVKPIWWNSTYDSGDGFTGYGNDYSSNNSILWDDISSGLIRRGPRAGVDDRFVREYLLDIIPVDSSGELVPVTSILEYMTGSVVNLQNPMASWKFGDYSPVEMIWRKTSDFKYDEMICRSLLDPSNFSEFLWDTKNVTITPGGQLINSNTFMLGNTSDISTHGEMLDGKMVYSLGYQHLLSVFLMSRGSDATVLGDLIRSSTMQLGYRMGGFTNSVDAVLELESVTNLEGSASSGLVIPTNDIEFRLHKSSVSDVTVYSGMIVVSQGGGSVAVYGYDYRRQTFKFLKPNHAYQEKRENIGGTPQSFVDFSFDRGYLAGDIVKHNGSFYMAKKDLVVSNIFSNQDWDKISEIPTIGGIDVMFNMHRLEEVGEIEYGHVFSNISEFYDFMYGYGKFLESEGWVFDEINEYGQVEDWKLSADRVIFWLSGNPSVNDAISVSPSSLRVKFEYQMGVPQLENPYSTSYPILERRGFGIPIDNVVIERDDNQVIVTPVNEDSGIFYLAISSYTYEHSFVIQNTTEFNDVVYDPLNGTRQNRIKFTGKRTRPWNGTYYAPGYLIDGNTVKQNIENSIDGIRNIYEIDKSSGNSGIDRAARALSGFQVSESLTRIGLDEKSQYDLYRGYIREKGTVMPLEKILRSSSIANRLSVEIEEDWALKTQDFGHSNRVSVELEIGEADLYSSPQIFRLSTKRAIQGKVDNIIIVSNDDVYLDIPQIEIEPPGVIGGITATANVTLNRDGKIDKVFVQEPGSGYQWPPTVTIIGNILERSDTEYDEFDNPILTDVLYSVIGSDEQSYAENVKIADFSLDGNNVNIVGSENILSSMERGRLNKFIGEIKHAGYVRREEVDVIAFNPNNLIAEDVIEGNRIWVANNLFSEWDVFKIMSLDISIAEGEDSKAITNISYFSSFSTFSVTELPNRVYGFSKDNFGIFSGTVFLIKDGELKQISLERIGNSDLIFLEDGEVLEHSFFDEVSDIFVLISKKFNSIDNLISTGNLLGYISPASERVYIEGNQDDLWQVYDADPDFSLQLVREEMEVIKSNNIDTASLFRNDEIEMQYFPYDPLQNVFGGIRSTHLSFIMPVDPVTYDNMSVEFSESSVGKLWLDTSSLKYIYYYPSNTSDSEVEFSSANWGRVFPGSNVTVYEWVSSENPPDEYSGEGTPINSGRFKRISKYNASFGKMEERYYFWVSGKTNSIGSSGPLVESEIRNMRSSSSWISTIALGTDGDFIFGINDIESKLYNTNGSLFVEYFRKRDYDFTHRSWSIKNHSDAEEKITDQVWTKMVDSLVGYTIPIAIDTKIGFKMHGGKSFIVPDPQLKGDKKYGIGFRPQQTMFSDILEARRNFVTITNSILSRVKLWEPQFLGWENTITENRHWETVDWFEDGFDENNTKTRIQVSEESELYHLNITNGSLVRVYPSVPTSSDRYKIFKYSDGVFHLVRYERGTIAIRSSIYSSLTSFKIGNELRSIINLVYGFINQNSVDKFKMLVLFDMIRYSSAERNSEDWSFKTSYISLKQNLGIVDRPVRLMRDSLDDFVSFIVDMKPYHTKISEIIQMLLNIGIDEAPGTAELLTLMKIKIRFNQFNSSGYILSDNNGSWDSEVWDATDPEYYANGIVKTDNFQGWNDGWDQGVSLINRLLDYSDEDITYENGDPSRLSNELVSLSPSESLYFDCSLETNETIGGRWDAEDWDNDNWDSLEVVPDTETEVKYRHLVGSSTSQYGFMYALSRKRSEFLEEDLDAENSEKIKISGNQLQTEAGLSNLVWVGSELVTYGSIIEEGGSFFLVDLVRGYLDTKVSNHPSGTQIFDASLELNSGKQDFLEINNFGTKIKNITSTTGENINVILLNTWFGYVNTGTESNPVIKFIPLENNAVILSENPY